METTYYTFTAREILVEGDAVQQVSGGARQLVCVRKADSRPEGAGRGKVIDLADWKAAQEERKQPETLWYSDAEEEAEPEGAEEPVKTAARPRKKRSRVLGAELWATLSVVGAMVLLMVRILGGF